MPNTSPDRWFLPASDMARSPNYTSDNEVVPLTDGMSYFAHLSKRLEAMKGGYIHIAGYRLTPSIPLMPSTSPPGPPLVNQLIDLMSKGVTVRLAVWYLPLALLTFFARPLPTRRFNHHKDNVDIVQAINSAAKRGAKPSAATLDQRLPFPSLFLQVPTTLASHHQKIVLLRSEDHDWAYVGSTDLAVDRWDTSSHASPRARLKEYWEAYHDIHCVLRGPAVAQIWEVFRQRWNDTTPPARYPSPVPIIVPPPITGEPPAPASYGSQHVQVLQTLACRDVYSFAPHGEQTVRKALERAVDRAEHYIYVEEQFFWPCSLVDHLATAVKRNPLLKVVILLAEELEFGGALRIAHHEMRNEAIAKVTGTSVNQVFVYCLQQPLTRASIYVHPKLIIIDDCFVGIGSANINKRSLTTDSELHLGIVDSSIIPSKMNGSPVSVCKFARELRVSLWSEHLGVSASSQLEDPITALSLWPKCSKSTLRNPSRVHHTICYHPRTETATLVEWLEVMRALRASFPQLPPPWETLVDLDQAIDAAELFASTTGIDVPSFLPRAHLFVLTRMLKNLVMNIETTC